MLTKFRVQRYKSLFDTEVNLEPLTVFIGPNGSGKSNICEAIAVVSNFLQILIDTGDRPSSYAKDLFTEAVQNSSNIPNKPIISKFWHGESDYLYFEAQSNTTTNIEAYPLDLIHTKIGVHFNSVQQKVDIRIPDSRVSPLTGKTKDSGTMPFQSRILRSQLISKKYLKSPISHDLKLVRLYDFDAKSISSQDSSFTELGRTGEGLAYALVDILLTDRKKFDELESRLQELVPNIERISLKRSESNAFGLELVDRYSDHRIPASDISDGTLKILAFLTALYQDKTPSILCFEEPENGVHPWLLHKMMELLKLISTEGITGQPVQVLLTTHSPLLLNYVEPHQVRAVELDAEGKTQVHALPTDSKRFQKALEAYDGELGELWFTNIFGGNPA